MGVYRESVLSQRVGEWVSQRGYTESQRGYTGRACWSKCEASLEVCTEASTAASIGIPDERLGVPPELCMPIKIKYPMKKIRQPTIAAVLAFEKNEDMKMQ